MYQYGVMFIINGLVLVEKVIQIRRILGRKLFCFFLVVIGSFGEIQLATPEVLNSLKEKGINISKFVSGGASDGRLSPTSAAVASITESDQTVSSLLTQSVEISNAEGVNIPISELLDGSTPVSSADGGNEDKPEKQNISGEKYVTQLIRDRKTGECVKFRVPRESIDTSRIKTGSATTGT